MDALSALRMVQLIELLQTRLLRDVLWSFPEYEDRRVSGLEESATLGLVTPPRDLR